MLISSLELQSNLFYMSMEDDVACDNEANFAQQIYSYFATWQPTCKSKSDLPKVEDESWKDA